MRKALIVCVIAAGAFCALASAAQAVKKFESTVAWTHIEKPTGDDDPTLMGTVTSESPKCIKGRKVAVTDELSNTLTKTTDANGIFGLSNIEIFETLPGWVYDTQLKKKKFGKEGRRKICLPDSATFTFIEDQIPTTISDLAYDGGTNTFTGTLVSEDPACLFQRGVEIYDTADFNAPIGSTTSDNAGAFAYTHISVPPPGMYDAYAPISSYLAFEPDGDGVAGTCAAADSNDISIGAARRAPGESSGDRATKGSLGLSKAG